MDVSRNAGPVLMLVLLVGAYLAWTADLEDPALVRHASGLFSASSLPFLRWTTHALASLKSDDPASWKGLTREHERLALWYAIQDAKDTWNSDSTTAILLPAEHQLSSNLAVRIMILSDDHELQLPPLDRLLQSVAANVGTHSTLPLEVFAHTVPNEVAAELKVRWPNVRVAEGPVGESLLSRMSPTSPDYVLLLRSSSVFVRPLDLDAYVAALHLVLPTGGALHLRAGMNLDAYQKIIDSSRVKPSPRPYNPDSLLLFDSAAAARTTSADVHLDELKAFSQPWSPDGLLARAGLLGAMLQGRGNGAMVADDVASALSLAPPSPSMSGSTWHIMPATSAVVRQVVLNAPKFGCRLSFVQLFEHPHTWLLPPVNATCT